MNNFRFVCFDFETKGKKYKLKKTDYVPVKERDHRTTICCNEQSIPFRSETEKSFINWYCNGQFEIHSDNTLDANALFDDKIYCYFDISEYDKINKYFITMYLKYLNDKMNLDELDDDSLLLLSILISGLPYKDKKTVSSNLFICISAYSSFYFGDDSDFDTVITEPVPHELESKLEDQINQMQNQLLDLYSAEQSKAAEYFWRIFPGIVSKNLLVFDFDVMLPLENCKNCNGVSLYFSDHKKKIQITVLNPRFINSEIVKYLDDKTLGHLLSESKVKIADLLLSLQSEYFDSLNNSQDRPEYLDKIKHIIINSEFVRKDDVGKASITDTLGFCLNFLYEFQANGISLKYKHLNLIREFYKAVSNHVILGGLKESLKHALINTKQHSSSEYHSE